MADCKLYNCTNGGDGPGEPLFQALPTSYMNGGLEALPAKLEERAAIVAAAVSLNSNPGVRKWASSAANRSFRTMDDAT